MEMKCHVDLESEDRMRSAPCDQSVGEHGGRASGAPPSNTSEDHAINQTKLLDQRSRLGGIASILAAVTVLGLLNLALTSFETTEMWNTKLKHEPQLHLETHSSQGSPMMLAWLHQDKANETNKCKNVSSWLADKRQWSVDVQDAAPLDELDRLLLEEVPLKNGLVLHQTWKTTCIPSVKNASVESWLEKDASIRIVFWEDKSMDAWVRVHFTNTDVERLWDMFGDTGFSGVKRADFFRLLVLFYYGGLYMDLDVMALRSWQPLLDEYEALVAWEPDWAMQRFGWVEGQPKNLMLVGVLGASRRFHPFFEYALLHVIDGLIHAPTEAQACNPVDCTGPKPVATAFNKYTALCHDITLRDLENHLINSECDECFANHLGGCTWCENTNTGSCTPIEELVPHDRLIMPDAFLLSRSVRNAERA